MITRKNLMLFLFLSNVYFAFAQLDTIHYLPPLYANTIVDKDFGEQYVVLSTNESTPFTVTMFNNAGRSQQVQISKSQPQIVDLGYQQAAWGVVEKSSLNTALNDDGMVLVAAKPFFVNARHRSTVQGLMLTTKGKVAAGLEFYTGHIYTVYGENTRPRNHFVSIMATEDNTQITLSNPDAKYYNQSNNSFTITLNKYQSYVVADEINLHTWSGSAYDPANIISANAINGTHITSDKPIVVNTGSWLGGGSSTVQDIGGDQIVPVEYVGKEYAINKGRGSTLNEKALVVSTAVNTTVSVNGVAVTTLTNAGDHIFLDDSYFTASGLMYVETSKAAYIYQTLGADNSDAAIGMSFIPPLNCMANTKVNIPFATQMIANVDMADPNGNSPILSLVTKAGSAFTVNGTDISAIISGYPNNSGPNVITGTDWVSYTISDFNFTGFTPTGVWNFEIDAEHAINASLSIRDDLIGAGCYFSGFGDDPLLTKEPVIAGGTACYPDNAILRASGFPSYQWQLGGSFISGESADSLVVNDLGFYRVRGVTTCDGVAVTSKFSEYVEINPCISINNVSITEPNAAQDVTFTVSLGTIYAQDVTFNYEAIPGTATQNKDFTGKQGIITIPAGSTEAYITISVLPDEVDEYDEQFTVQLTNPVNCDFSIPVGTCTIVDNDDPGSYSFASAAISVREGTDTVAVFTVNLDEISEKLTWVRYATNNISATAGQDYTATADTLFFAPGTTTGSILIPILNDDIFEPALEQFVLNIVQAGNLAFNNLASSKLALITDDDTPVFFSVLDTQVVEGNDLNFWITIDKPYPIDLEIDYSTQDDQATVADNDYTETSGTALFPAGTTSVKISVPTGDDEIDENDENVKFNLSNLPSPHGIFNKPSANGLIIDDDCTPLAVNDALTTPEETLLNSVYVLDNDQGLCDTPLVLAVVKMPSHALTFSFNTADGGIEYEPVLNYFGKDTISYSITDADGQTTQADAIITVTNVNDIPVAVDTALTFNEDQTVTFTPLGNDLDIDKSGLSLVSITSVSNATVTIDANGTDLHFTPDPDFNGIVTFDYTMEDGEGDQATATITITINPVNDNPGAVNDNVSTDEDILSAPFDPLVNDYDADNSGISLFSMGSAANGTITDLGDGTFTYQPNLNYNGTDSASYVIQDGEGDQATGKIYFTVNPINDPPVAVLENRITQEDTPININVLANDSDVDGNLSPSGVTITQNPLHGTIVVEANGTVTYTPAANYFGQDNFYYKLIDDAGAESNTVMDRILVFPMDDMPVAVNDTATTVEDNASPLVVSPLANDVDPDNSGLILSIVTQPANGTAVLSGNTISYSSNLNYYGMDSILYQIKEVGAGGGTAQAYIIITVTPVNDFPVANDDAATLTEDNTIDIDVLANDEDPDLTGLTIVAVSAPGNGTATISGNQIHYVPDADYFGADAFTYTIEDGQGDQATATVSVTVDPDDSDVPVANNDFVTTDEDVSVDINPVLNDQDPDLSGLIMTVVTAPVHGNITSVTGNVITYEPSPNYNGQDTIVYQIQEAGAGGSTDQAMIVITVTPVNDIPVANDDSYTINEDVVSDFDVMANDEDPDFNGISIVSLGAPAHGTATVVAGLVHYVPDADYFGSDVFTYTIEDYNGDQATADISVTITADDTDAPVPVDDTVVTDEDVAVVISPLTNDYDPDLTGLTLSIVSAPDSGLAVISGSDITYTPNADFNGLDSIQYQVEEVGANNQTATAWIRITVNPVNDLPDALDDAITVLEDNTINIDPLVNDSDPDRGGLTITHITGPVNGTGVINAGSTIDYTPDADFFGSDSIVYTIADMDGDLDSAIIRITVTADYTDAPVSTDDAVITDEDVAVVISPLTNDYDPDLTGLTLSIVSAPDSGLAVISGSDMTYTPNADFNGLDSIQYQVEEVGANNQTATAWIRITVNPVNDLPDALDDAITVLEDNTINIDPLVNDSDPDRGGLTITHITGPVNGTGAINAGSTIDYTPDADFFGSDSIVYTVADMNGDLDSAIIRITVTADDTDAPVATDDAVITDEDVAVVVSPLTNDYDPDRTGLTINLVSSPDSGSVVISGSDMTYTPNPDFFGMDSLEYQVEEVGANNQTATAWIFITVNPVSDLPEANMDTITVNEDDQDTVYVLVNDIDHDRGGLKVIDLGPSPNSVSQISTDSTYVIYIPNPDYFGSDSLYYFIEDVDGDIDSALIKATVIYNDADAPDAVRDTFIFNEDESGVVLPMANDYDPDRSGLIMTLITPPDSGQFINQGDTAFLYIPPANYHGTDTAIYQIQEVAAGMQTDIDTMIFIVYAVNDTPVAVIDSLVLDEDTRDSVYVLLNDLDPDYSGIQLVDLVSTPNALAEISSDSTYIRYTPMADFFGSDSVLYYIADGEGDLDSAYILVTVSADTSDVPVANDDYIVITEDMDIDIVPLANDYDPDRTGLILTILKDPDNGIYILHNDTVSYSPDPNFNGRDTIYYQIQEAGAGQSLATAYIYIEIDTINERPVANPDSISIYEDSSDTIWVLVNDIDLDWEGIIVDSVSMSDTATVELTADSTGVIYTPSANFYGADSVFYILRDAQGDLDTAWIYINVIAVNDTPHAQNDFILINEDETGSVNILANDEDPDRQGVDITTGIQVQNGSISIDPNGDVVYTPDANYFGSDSLMYYITDKENDVDSAWLYITVTAVNDTPVVVNDNAIMLEETVTDIPILINDFDVEGPIPFDSIFIAFTTNNGDAILLPGTGVIRYTPVFNYYGLDSLGYYVKDNEGLASDTAYVYITVMNVNDIPVATDDTVNIQEDSNAVIAVLANDEDPDHSGLDVTIVNGPANGIANLLNDTVYYTPDANFFGNDTIQYIIVDGEGDTVSANILITVESVNDLPVANDDVVSILEETTVDIPVLVNDSDVEAAIPLDSVFIVSSAKHGVANLISGTGVINYLPEVNFFGNDTITYYVKDTDGAMSDTAMVVITVQNVNENPDASDDYYYMPEDSVIELMILVNDLDADRSGLSLDSVSVPFHGTLVMDKAPDTITYIPEPDYFGMDSILYFIADGELDMDSAWIFIEIYPVNDVPVAVNDTIIISDMDGDTLAILANDYDVETTLTGNHVVIEVLPTMGSAYIDFTTGDLIYFMDADFYYSDSLMYVITDDEGASDTAMVYIMDRDSILDSDDDGIPNLVEGDEDMVDMDGIPNYLDLDSDGDQIPDAIEGLLDRDDNGIEDYIDPFDWDADSDGDGLPNRYEDTNNDGNPYNDDCDGDGLVNYLDDTDNCEDYLDIPNGFSPNGDGINDLFCIEGLWNFPDAEIYIFNQWGNRVFDMKYYGDEDRYGPYEAWWNGQSNRIGKADVPEGVYFYRLTLGRGRKVKEGYIHLRR
ncbi:Ig-like domain-containing protein [Saccharicrinis sp. FJH54]|uniref:Ig-like domain-containing protein n=1 Tax=Saccharicrinis sp. FJH54 TaxID=3344665 RepID=UPI0035D49D87